MIAFVDLDDVCADFCGAAAKAHGLPLPPAPWNGWGLDAALELTDDEFWAPINRTSPGFWLDLQPLKDGLNLLTYLNSIQLPWFILTSPGKQSHAYSAKVEWCRRHLRAHEHQVIVTKNKPLLAAPGRLLIDDNPQNCKDWMVHGGTAIIWPQPGNVFHTQQADPLPRVLYGVNQFITNQRPH